MILKSETNQTISSIQHTLSLSSPRLVFYVLSNLLINGFVSRKEGLLSLSHSGKNLLHRNKQEHKHVFFLSIEEHPLRDSLDWASKVPYFSCAKTDWIVELDSSHRRPIHDRISEVQNLMYRKIPDHIQRIIDSTEGELATMLTLHSLVVQEVEKKWEKVCIEKNNDALIPYRGTVYGAYNDRLSLLLAKSKWDKKRRRIEM